MLPSHRGDRLLWRLSLGSEGRSKIGVELPEATSGINTGPLTHIPPPRATPPQRASGFLTAKESIQIPAQAELKDCAEAKDTGVAVDPALAAGSSTGGFPGTQRVN